MIKGIRSQIAGRLSSYPEHIKKVLRAWVDFSEEAEWVIADKADIIRELLNGAEHDAPGQACSESAAMKSVRVGSLAKHMC